MLGLQLQGVLLYAVCSSRFIPYLKGIFDLGSTDRVWVDAAGSYPNLLDAETKELLGTDFVDSTTDVAVIKGSAIRYDRYPRTSKQHADSETLVRLLSQWQSDLHASGLCQLCHGLSGRIP